MLTHFQKRKLTRYFNCLDVDGNGFFEKEDLDIIVTRLAKTRNVAEGTEEYEGLSAGISMIWDYARKYGESKNEDKVSLADWLAHEDYILASEDFLENYMRAITRGVFDLVDADGSGEISVEEYTEIMSAFGVAEGIPEWSFKHLDLNGDGKISKDEFVTIVEQFHLSQDRDAPGNFLFGPY
jgi:juvenile hormone diol kinase